MSVALDQTRKQGDNRCPYHHMDVVLSCKDCNGELVCLKCTTTKHQCHKLQDMSEIASNTKSKIRDNIRKNENVKLSDIQHQITCLNDEMIERENSIQNVERKIKPHREKIKVEIDRILDNYIDTYQNITRVNNTRLLKYQQELKSFHKQMSLCRTTLESENEVLIIDVGKEIGKDINQPEAPELLTLDQVAPTFSVEELKQTLEAIHMDIQGNAVSMKNTPPSSVPVVPVVPNAAGAISSKNQGPSNVQNMNVITDETASVYVPQESSANEQHPISADVSVKPDSNANDNGAHEMEYTQSPSNTNSSQQEQESEILTEFSTMIDTQQQATAPLELSDTPSVLGVDDNSPAVVMPQRKEEMTSKEPSSPESSIAKSKIGQPEETKFPEVVPETETSKELPVQHIEEPKSEQGSASNDSNITDVGELSKYPVYQKGVPSLGQNQGERPPLTPVTTQPTQPQPHDPRSDCVPGPGSRVPQPHNQFMQTRQTGVSYQMPQTGNQQFNPITVYATQNQGQRPPSAPVTAQSSQPQRWREKHILTIVDPNTGKDVTNETLHPVASARATPPGSGGSGSGSRSASLGNTPPPIVPVVSNATGATSAIAAQFAAQVAATLKSDTQDSQTVNIQKTKEEWKPSRRANTIDTENSEDKKTEAIYKKVRSILNKITPQTFQTLVKQMRDLKIDTEFRLQGVTDLVFEKAVSMPERCVAYASLCRYLATMKVPSQTKPGEFVNFRAILLTRCQEEFEKDVKVDIEKKQKKLNETKEEDQKVLKMKLEQAETNARKRFLGNARFIGELFKLKMLTENIMHDCVFKLLKAKDPDSLECLCTLLTTIGKELDTDKAKPRTDQYFQAMSKVVSEKKMASRIRFLLQDVIELRQNKWVPKTDENNPKTLTQIHKDAQREEQERQIAIQQAAVQQATRGNDRQGRGRRGGSQQGGQPGGSDGWNTVQGRQPGMRLTTTERQTIDPSRLKPSRQNVDEGIQLGPGYGAGRFAGWQRESTGGGAGASQEGERPNEPSNRFSALRTPEEESRGKVGASPDRGRSFGRPARVTPRSSQEQERERVLAAVRSISGGQTTPRDGPSRESSRGRETKEEKKVEKTPQAAPTKKLSEEEMEKKTKSILDEYLHLQDIKEAILCVEELNCPDMLHVFVSQTLNYVLERSGVARRQTGHLLHDLIIKGVLPVNVYITGLHEILQYAEDLEIDIPKIWQYFGELISPMIQDGGVNLSFLKSAVEPLQASNKSGVLLAEILHDASNREGHKTIAGLWKASGLQWSDFVLADKVKQFLIDRKLEFTETGTSQPSTPVTSMPMEKVREHLDSLLQRKNANEEIFDWIESSLDDATTNSKKFVRMLMTSVCSSAISGKGSSAKVDPRQVTLRRVILQKYLDHRADFELQALYAVQALVHKLEHPPGVLQELFDNLYDEDVISEDAFNHWQKSDDCAEQEGKGVAVSSVAQFFTWLGEVEDMSDS